MMLRFNPLRGVLPTTSTFNQNVPKKSFHEHYINNVSSGKHAILPSSFPNSSKLNDCMWTQTGIWEEEKVGGEEMNWKRQDPKQTLNYVPIYFPLFYLLYVYIIIMVILTAGILCANMHFHLWYLLFVILILLNVFCRHWYTSMIR